MSVFADIFALYKKNKFPIPSTPTLLNETFMHQRLNFILEELSETADAYSENDLDEVIDGLIDIMVVACGTLILMGVKGQLHWNEVQRANMAKERGKKPGRVMQLDLFKPDGWIGPDHEKIRESYDK